MKIKVKYLPTREYIKVRTVPYLEGQVRSFIDNLHRAQAIDRVILRGGRIVWIGGNELSKKQEVDSYMKEISWNPPF